MATHSPEVLAGSVIAVVAAVVAARTGGRGREAGGAVGRGSGSPVSGRLGSWRTPAGTRRGGGAHWASRRELGPLVVAARPPGRLVLGMLAPPGRGPGRRSARRPGRTLLAVEPRQSVAVVGPTQSGKTSGLAVPAILGWEGPVLAASVKVDLLRDTIARRRRRGLVWNFDPGGVTGEPASLWSPLPAARTWSGARRVAADLTEVAQGGTTTADGEFWYATAAKLLAPLLFAAAGAGLAMADVVRWVDTQEVDEVVDILAAAGVPEPLQAARATWQRDERQRGSVYTTAETVLEPFAEPSGASLLAPHDLWPPGGRTGWAAGHPIGPPADTPPFGIPAAGRATAPGAPARTGRGTAGAAAGPVDPVALLAGTNTLYACAPAHDQRRFRALFTAVVKEVLQAAFDRSTRQGSPLAPPLLVVLDEAANIAPLAELDGLAATCAGHGVQLVTVWQDMAQITARYGERAATVVNNHRAKLFLSGISDPRTLDHASQLAGDEEILVPTVSRDPSGARTVTASPAWRRLLPPDALRRLPPGTGVLLYGSLPPARVALRPWFRDPSLRERVPGGGDGPVGPAGHAGPAFAPRRAGARPRYARPR